MNEIITVLASQQANHVVTHLFNVQESHIPYTKAAAANLSYNNHVFLLSTKTNGKTNYVPRSVLFDLAGGLGSYWPHEYYEKKQDLTDLEGNLQVIHTGEPQSKNQYQKNLDKGITNNQGLLTEKNTRFWTDYNKMIYKPSSLVELHNWEYNPGSDGTHRNFPNRQFSYFPTGCEEYEENAELAEKAEDSFRKFLEDSDLVQGVNFLTEIDSAWSGFTNSLLVSLKDEYFNNGTNSKYNLWTYGFMDDIKSTRMVSRIVSLVQLSKNSTLLFPLSQGQDTLTENYDKTSLWHTSASPALFINSLWSLHNNASRPVLMSHIEDELLKGGFDQRNIVNEIKVKQNKKQDIHDLQNVNIAELYMQASQPKELCSDLSIASTKDNRVINKSIIAPSSIVDTLDSGAKIYENNTINDITKMDTFPHIYKYDDPFYVEFAQTDSFKSTLKCYRKIIERSRVGALIESHDDKLELIEDICMLIDQYTVGYDSDDEFDI